MKTKVLPNGLHGLTCYERATVVLRAGGFEPPRVSLPPLPDSRSGVSASCTTRANAEAGVGIDPTYLGLRTQCLNHSATQPRMTARTAPNLTGSVPFRLKTQPSVPHRTTSRRVPGFGDLRSSDAGSSSGPWHSSGSWPAHSRHRLPWLPDATEGIGARHPSGLRWAVTPSLGCPAPVH